MVKHVATIKGDRAATHLILTDFSKYLEWYPECEKIAVIATTGSNVDVDLTLGGMKVARMTLRYDIQPDLITYDMVSSNDLKGFKGSYKIVDGDGGSHTVMMEVDLTASVPKFVTDRMMKSSLEKQAKQLQERNGRFSGGAAAAAPAEIAAASGPAASVPASASASGAAKVKRPRCLVRVKQTGRGTSIWYAGAEFQRK